LLVACLGWDNQPILPSVRRAIRCGGGVQMKTRGSLPSRFVLPLRNVVNRPADKWFQCRTRPYALTSYVHHMSMRAYLPVEFDQIQKTNNTYETKNTNSMCRHTVRRVCRGYCAGAKQKT